MANYLLLDENNIALNHIVMENEGDWTPPEGQRLILYDGPFWPNQPFDGTTVVDPNPPVEGLVGIETTTPPPIKGVETL